MSLPLPQTAAHPPTDPPSRLLDKRLDAIAIVLLVAAGVALALPLLQTPGIVNPGDFIMSVHRTLTLHDALGLGIYYPRFGDQFNFGYGAPLFQFYPPLASYVGLVFVALGAGYLFATKLVLTLALVAGSVGTYGYARFLLRNQFAAFVAGLVFLVSPYYMLVMYERGAVAEMMMWGLLPWLFWVMHRWYAWGRRGDGVLAALLVASAFLAHNATALFVVPGLFLYMTLLALLERRRSALPRVLLIFVLGAGISAFYWAPAMLEMSYTKSTEHMFNGATAIENNVVAATNVFQHNFMAQYAGVERFRFALWQFAAGIASLIALLVQRKRRPPALWLLAAAWLIVLLLQTEASLLFWQGVPFVRFIQFPWRLHGVGSFCTALLIAAAFMDVRPQRVGQQVLAFAGAGTVAAALVLLTLPNAMPAKSQIWLPWSEADAGWERMWERGRSGYPLWVDYELRSVPVGSTGYTMPRPADDPTRLPATSTPAITIARYHPERITLQVDAPTPWTLRLHRAWFPGWRVTVDGAPLATTAAGVGGLVSAEMPAGAYTAELWFGNSPLRLATTLLSIVSLAVTLALLRPKPLWQGALLATALALLLGGGIWLATTPLKPAVAPSPLRADFDNGISLLGYTVDQPLCTNSTVPIETWWHVANTPANEFKFFLHLITPDDSGRVAQADLFPSRGYNAMTRWEAGELVPQTLALEVGADVPEGRYALIIGMYNPEAMTNALVTSTGQIYPGDRLLLSQVDVAHCTP